MQYNWSNPRNQFLIAVFSWLTLKVLISLKLCFDPLSYYQYCCLWSLIHLIALEHRRKQRCHDRGCHFRTFKSSQIKQTTGSSISLRKMRKFAGWIMHQRTTDKPGPVGKLIMVTGMFMFITHHFISWGGLKAQYCHSEISSLWLSIGWHLLLLCFFKVGGQTDRGWTSRPIVKDVTAHKSKLARVKTKRCEEESFGEI